MFARYLFLGGIILGPLSAVLMEYSGSVFSVHSPTFILRILYMCWNQRRNLDQLWIYTQLCGNGGKSAAIKQVL